MKKVKYSSESLDSFINSAMNIEFVYLILLGINQFQIFKIGNANFSSTQGLNKVAPPNEKTKILIDKTGEKSHITFSDIKFKNINLWGID